MERPWGGHGAANGGDQATTDRQEHVSCCDAPWAVVLSVVCCCCRSSSPRTCRRMARISYRLPSSALHRCPFHPLPLISASQSPSWLLATPLQGTFPPPLPLFRLPMAGPSLMAGSSWSILFLLFRRPGSVPTGRRGACPLSDNTRRICASQKIACGSGPRRLACRANGRVL